MGTWAEDNHRGAFALPLTSRPPQRGGWLPPQTAAGRATYAVTTSWRESRDGEFVETVIEKQVAVAVVPQGDTLEITVEWLTPPVLRKPAPGPFDEVTLLLAEVYRKVVLTASAEGQLLALRNHAEMVVAWAAVKQRLGAYAGDATIGLLVQLLDTQISDASAVLASLQFDYFFAFFLKNGPPQGAETNRPLTRPICFPQFFSDVSIVFQETTTLVPATGLQSTHTLAFAGQGVETTTGRTAICQAIARRLGTGPAVEPDQLHFTYSATAVLEPATGLPVALDATVACGSRPRYQKEYILTVRRR